MNHLDYAAMEIKFMHHVEMMRLEIKEANQQIDNIHAAFLASKATMDSILTLLATSHPILAYKMRVLRSQYESRKHFQIRKRFEEKNEEIQALKVETKKLRMSVRQSPRQLDTKNKLLEIENAKMKRYIKKLEKMVHVKL